MNNNSGPLDNDPTMNETPSVYDPAPFDAPLDNDPTMTEDAMGTSPQAYNSNDDDMETCPEPHNSNDDGFSAAASATVAAASATAAAAGTYMWAALDATGMVSKPEDGEEEEEHKPDRIDAFDPFAMSDDEAPEGMDVVGDSDDEPNTSRSAPGAIAVANFDATYDKKLKGDTDSDTGDESNPKGNDSDSEAAAVLVAAVPDRDAEDKRERRMLIGAVFLVFFLAIFAGAYAGVQVEEERVEQARSTEFETIPSSSAIPKCFPGSNPTRATAFMQVALDGMSRQATSTELQQVQNALTGVYNGVTGGCNDVYERIMESASVVNQNLITDSKGKNHLSIDFTTNLRCDGCTAEEEYLFSPWPSASKGKASTSAKGKGTTGTTSTKTGKGTSSTAGGERKLRRGNRNARGVRGIRDLQSVAPAPPIFVNPGGVPATPSTGKGKGGKGKGSSNTRAQMFIDSLDATLQTSNLPLKKVKAAYIYEQTAVWKGEKLKLKPTKKEKKKDGKGKGTSDKISAGRRRRH
ncbi:unnamed protein product [Cylindrotheca closterium]|uniref:Uncharacterized protein n=1 Tax=Cylindrotheca closterium TaxID=2856 RepID=A0AAD2FZU6_9STRA|nr:unnamed protein product [Cylindrotheca closterium]